MAVLKYWDGAAWQTLTGNPTTHAITHQPGGSDPMAVDAAAATGSLRTLGTGAQQAVAGNDPRFPTYGTSLPASPVDGQEAILVDNVTTPSYTWRFRYNAGSSSAYKWEFVGGPPAVAVRDATDNLGVATGGWIDAPVPLTLAVTRGGDYVSTYRFSWMRAAGAGALFFGVGTTAGAAGSDLPFGMDRVSEANQWVNTEITTKHVGVPAAATFREKFNQRDASESVAGRVLTVLPVRV